MRITRALALVACLLAGCAGSGNPPPVEVELGGTDPEVVRLVEFLLEQVRASPGDAERRANLGMAYEVNGRVRAALASYMQAEAMDPGEPRWSYFTAIALAQLGELDRAVEALRGTLAARGDYVPAHLYLGQWLLDLGRPDAAAEAFAAAGRLQPDHPAAPMGLARCRLRQGRGEEAVRILEEVVDSGRGGAYASQLLGLAYREVGETDKARTALARGRPAGALAWPDPWGDAKAAYQTGFAADMHRVDALLGQRRYPEVVNLLEPHRAKGSTHPAMLTNLSIALRNTGQTEPAFQLLLEGLELHPDYFPLHLNIATTYERRDDVAQALHHLDRAIEINPTLGAAHERRAGILLRQKRLDEALDAYQTAVKYDARNAMNLVWAAMIQADLGQRDAAIESCERAIRVDPSLVMAHVTMGLVHIKRGDLAAAEIALDRAAALKPDHPRLLKVREILEAEKGGRQ